MKKKIKRKSTEHPLYRRWGFIQALINNPNDVNYQRYGGGQGLENHFPDFWTFADYVERHLGPIPFSNAKLNRIDCNDHFRPGNLRWATPLEVSRNQRKCHKITYKRKTLTLPEWAEEYGINYHTLFERFSHGWSFEQMIGLKPSPIKQKAMKK